MKELVRKYKRGCILLIALVFALLTESVWLNWLVSIPEKYSLDSDSISIIGSVAAYLSAIASFAMVLITWKTLQQNREILEEQSRPRLSFSIDVSQRWYVLKVANIGKGNAYNINLEINDDFIEALPEESSKRMFRRLRDRPFAVAINDAEYCHIGSCIEAITYWKDRCSKLKITGSYCDGKYKIDELIDINEYIVGGLIVEDTFTTEFQYFKKGVIVQNNSYMPIQKSLDSIAKTLEKFNNNSNSEEL